MGRGNERDKGRGSGGARGSTWPDLYTTPLHTIRPDLVFIWPCVAENVSEA